MYKTWEEMGDYETEIFLEKLIKEAIENKKQPEEIIKWIKRKSKG